MENNPSHAEKIVALKRVEGQIRGIQKMVEDGKYCVDILNQIGAAIRALAAVEGRILETHFKHCVAGAMLGKSASAKKRKLKEVLELISRFRRT